jgi:hypothetical protein
MKKLILLSVFLLGVILFSCEKEPLNATEKVIKPNVPAEYFWAWDCPVSGCSGSGNCICGQPMCVLLCDRCGHTLSSKDWSHRTCWSK